MLELDPVDNSEEVEQSDRGRHDIRGREIKAVNWSGKVKGGVVMRSRIGCFVSENEN
jgi:hypothetical protein